jgi:hypothetical protein
MSNFGGFNMAKAKVAKDKKKDEGLKLSKSPRGRFNELGQMEKEQKKERMRESLPAPSAKKSISQSKAVASPKPGAKSTWLKDGAKEYGVSQKRFKEALEELKSHEKRKPGAAARGASFGNTSVKDYGRSLVDGALPKKVKKKGSGAR